MRRLFKVGSDRHDQGRVIFSWHPEGNYLASVGKNCVVQITDRHGDIVEEIPMSGNAAILALEWDKDGENLAILQSGNGVVPLWSLSTRRVVPLETSLRDPTFLAWSKTGPQLAVGTLKGNLLIYNKAKKQKIPIMGKHSKRILSGAWSLEGNKLVLGSEDRSLTISNESGDTLMHTEVKYVPVQTNFTFHAASSTGGGGGGGGANDDNMVSANLSGKSLYLLNIMDEKEEPVELSFPQSGAGCKGEIVHHTWFDDNQILIGFSLGHLQVHSTNLKNMGEEKNTAKIHTSNMSTFSYNPILKRAATAGTDGVRVVDIREFRESKQDYIPPEDLEDGRITDLQWSPDGQILTIGTDAGNVYNFLAKMSVLNAKYKTCVAYLSSLREVSVTDAVKRSRPIDVTLKLEPSLIALGAKHVAAGMNNRVYYHRISARGEGGAQIIHEQEYVGTVREVQLNQAYAVVLTDNKANLHPIEPAPAGGPAHQTMTFPGREEGSYSRISCIALTDDFLYYGTEAGTVEVFYIAEWVMLPGTELRLDNAIRQIFPNSTGTKLVVVDSANQTFLFNPVTGGGVNQSITRFETAPASISTVLWDIKEKNVVILYDGKFVHTYVYVQQSMKGPLLTKLGPVTVNVDGQIELNPDKVECAPGNIPIMCNGGTITCQTATGTLTTVVHPYFDQLVDGASSSASSSPSSKGSSKRSEDRSKDTKMMISRFCQSLAMLKLETAWQAALDLDRLLQGHKQFWLALSGKAMELLNIELACRVYRQLGDAGMVMALQELMHVEDNDLLAGHISLLFCEYSRAQELFLQSSRPLAALEMRRDLLQWDQALKLAQTLSVVQVPDICVQYGQQLEFRGEIDQALRMFENALNAQDSKGRSICPEVLVPLAMMGVARCNLRQGNIRQGLHLANELDDRQLFQDAGDILEQQKQYSEAAAMFIKGQQYERAAFIYTKYLIRAEKSRITEAVAVMEKVNNDQLNAAFAKACVGAGRFEEAARAYERANDMDKVVELRLRNLDQVQSAFDLVRQGASAQGAQLVAEYCQEKSDFRGAIEFLLLANKSEEAFRLAQTNSLVEVYASLLGDGIGSDEAMQVAVSYEKAQDYGKAGRYYSMCSQYARALKLFIQCGDREIDAAIEVVGKSQNEALTHQLIDFLVGEKDGVPKDPNYIYRLYMALKKYEDAAKTALIIARQEQDMGNYTLAHSVVFETISSLEEAGIKVALQLRQQFVLLHSYLRVKGMVRVGDHAGAAMLLLRVAQNASKFPQHVVKILTLTVIECQRAGLKASSYEYAVQLMRPEHRQAIDVALKRKIEAIVRRRTDVKEEAQEEMTMCPVSNQPIPASCLECPTTRDALPMCVVTGRHMVLDDWCFCPVSKSPALYSAYKRYIEVELQAAADAGTSTADAASVAAASGGGDGESKSSSSSSANGGGGGGGGSSGTGLSFVALDPVLGKPVTSSSLKLCTVEEATKYIQRYNNVLEEKKKDNEEGEEGEERVEEGDGMGTEDGEESKSSSSKGGKVAMRKRERKARR